MTEALPEGHERTQDMLAWTGADFQKNLDIQERARAEKLLSQLEFRTLHPNEAQISQVRSAIKSITTPRQSSENSDARPALVIELSKLPTEDEAMPDQYYPSSVAHLEAEIGDIDLLHRLLTSRSDLAIAVWNEKNGEWELISNVTDAEKDISQAEMNGLWKMQ